jgi:SNF2 family DNA or RNA helicase
MRLLRFTGYKGPFLIMGPLVTIRNWGKEIDRHSGSSLTWGAVLGTVAKKKKVIEQAAAGEFDALLITYDTARNFVEQLHETVPYNVVIADESHLIKDYKAARTKAALEIVQKAGRRLIMTGTPTLGNPLDLYGQFKFLGDYFMPENWHHYRNVFLNLSPYNKHLVLGYKNLKLLNERTVFLSLRKTKAECLDLPPQTFVDVDVELSTGQIQAANTLITEMGLSVAQIEEHLDGAANNDAASLGFLQLPHVATLLIKLLQINAGFLITPTTDPQFCDNAEPGGCRHIQKCVPLGVKPYTGGCAVVQEKPEDKIEIFKENPKLDALSELLDTLLGGPDNKVIVWCYFQAEMNIVAKRLEEAGIGYVRVDGKTGSKAQTYIDQFNTDPEKRVYLGQISTGVGITLNAANYMVYYSLTFSLGVYLQSLDRNYRIGQSKNVTVYRLLAKRTIEPTMMRLLENKVDVDAALTKAGQSINNLVRVVTRPREL